MTSIPTYQQIRSMKGRGTKVYPLSLAVGQVIRVDGTKYRVQDAPVQEPVTGSIRVEGYNEDNQYESLFLNGTRPVTVLGAVD